MRVRVIAKMVLALVIAVALVGVFVVVHNYDNTQKRQDCVQQVQYSNYIPSC